MVRRPYATAIAVVCLATGALSGNDPLPCVHRTAHFAVEAADAMTARAVAERADEQRRALAVAWFGQELPGWAQPCTVRVCVALGPPGGVTHFTYAPNPEGKSTVTSIAMEVCGPLDVILRGVVPHEVAHAVLTSHFGCPVPRWADEGLAILGEPDDIQSATDLRLRDLHAAGRTIQVKTLLGLKDYPADRYTVYAQGHSVARFLLTRRVRAEGRVGGNPAPIPGRRGLVRFVETGMARGWDEASKTVYGFASLEALEAGWTEWLSSAESRFGN